MATVVLALPLGGRRWLGGRPRPSRTPTRFRTRLVESCARMCVYACVCASVCVYVYPDVYDVYVLVRMHMSVFLTSHANMSCKEKSIM